MEKFVLTIDGPSGVGKTSIGKKLSSFLDCNFFSSGNLYRSIAKYMYDNDKNIDDHFEIKIVDNSSYINGVTYNHEFLYENKISIKSSKIAKSENIRNNVKESLLRYYLSLKQSLVIEGRDMGSVVFKSAKYKVYLDADLEIRGKRREGQSQMDETVTDLANRDIEDKNRSLSPLIIPKEAFVIDNTGLNIDQTVETIIDMLKLR